MRRWRAWAAAWEAQDHVSRERNDRYWKAVSLLPVMADDPWAWIQSGKG